MFWKKSQFDQNCDKQRDQQMSKYVHDHYYFLKASLEIVLRMCETNMNYYIAVNARSPQYNNY